VQLSFKYGNLNFLEVSGPLQAYTGIALSFFLARWGKAQSAYTNVGVYVFIYKKENTCLLRIPVQH